MLYHDPASFDARQTTGQSLARWARERPDAVAIAGGDTYRALAFNVLRAIDALAAAGVRAGEVLGVETPDRYLHLLLVLAADALSATTLSLIPSEFGPPTHLDRLCDRVMVSQPVAFDPARVTMLDQAWITAMLTLGIPPARLAELDRPAASDAMIRFTRSSGTSGIPKVMGLSRLVQNLGVRNYWLPMPPAIARHIDFLCLYNFTVGATLPRVLLALRLGGTVHFTAGDAVWEAIQAGTGNYVFFVAGDLARFVHAAPAGQGPFEVQIDVIGAAVPAQLRDRIRGKITNHLTVTYSSTEVQRVSIVDDDNIGTLFPDVRVRIVGAHGEPLPLGERGTITLRTGTMANGYFRDAALTKAAFIDGWYHTSDVGFQPAEDRLVVLGRRDDMLNVGGIKIPPGPIEDRIKAIESVRDAMVTSVDDVADTDVLLVAVETDAADLALLRQRVAPIISDYTTNFRLIAQPAFPRTGTGKIRREAVRQDYMRRGN